MHNLFLGMALGVTLASGLVSFFPEHTRAYKDGFQQGQIKVIRGDIKFELKEQPDGTTKWVEKINK